MEDSTENFKSSDTLDPELSNDSSDLERLQERESSPIYKRNYWELENYKYW